MKKLTVIALSLIAASAAMAEGLSREQVVAELQRARAANELQLMHSENPDFGRSAVSGAPGRSRAEVLAELQRARASGELAVGRRNAGGYAHLDALGKVQPAAAKQEVLAAQ